VLGSSRTYSTRSFGSAFEKYYLLRLGYNSITVLVRSPNAANIGLRRVNKDRRSRACCLNLSYGDCSIHPDWKVRCKENTEKMQSGSLLQAAQVFKELLLLQVDKQLSFARRKMLERARHMLVSEISLVRAFQACMPSISSSGPLPRLGYSAAAS